MPAETASWQAGNNTSKLSQTVPLLAFIQIIQHALAMAKLMHAVGNRMGPSCKANQHLKLSPLAHTYVVCSCLPPSRRQHRSSTTLLHVQQPI
jgi:hypothetical protein